jgi:NAD(P)-dependent dehydrogenase (short-subunit alcohol dehydrogenase family)
LPGRLKKKYGVESEGFESNVLDKDFLIANREQILDRFGKIDILINAAGGNAPEATTKIEELNRDNLDRLDEGFFGLKMDAFKKVFDLNFTGTLLPTMVFC